MARTNIVIDDRLLNEGMKLTRFKTKKELVNVALQEFIRWRRRMKLLKLEGKIEFSEGYDYKELRTALHDSG
ncbi:MAG: type II toxin-antitoxin system VapB family antitoxin [Deltaproteobacteria bacterium]|jgi:Arc/MetJ family transcription regulator|nr:type II toxin-antitoxin system VapB family antitoxin [Deltaproteobacteria bacterium]MDP3028327.1 type II toxin-antitoxin system VapB family antitoxin [Deltaproteobacteria bacterium]